jgi:AraC family transcriptional regulator
MARPSACQPDETGAPHEFIGSLHSQRHFDGFLLGHWLSPASAPPIEPHGHDTAHVVIVTAGTFRSEAVGPAVGPTIVFNPAGTYHADHFEGQGAFIGLSLADATSRRLHELDLPDRPTRIGGPLSEGIVGQLMRAVHAGHAERDDLVVDALCYEMLGQLERGDARGHRFPKWLRAAADYLRDGGEACGGVEAAARAVGVHPVHLARGFRRHYRCTPGEFRRAHQVGKAASLLAGSRLPVARVAAECSFADQSHLVRSFRRHFGMSPRQFRGQLA